MQTILLSTLDARNQFTETINRVAHNKERIILTRRGKEIVAIIPLEDLKLIEESQNKQDLQEATDALKEARIQGTVTLEQLKNEMGIL